MSTVRSRWVVAVHDVGDGDAEPFESGPWPEVRAREIAGAFNRARGEVGWHATAYPLVRHGARELVTMHEPQREPGSE